MTNLLSEAITVYPLVAYGSESKAKDAFLDIYFGDGGFNRPEAAKMAGLELKRVEKWFSSPAFFDKLEIRLQNTTRRKSSMQDTLLSESMNIMEANMADLFLQTEGGNMILRPLTSLPRELSSCIRELTLVRRSERGRVGVEFTEALNVKMYDKTKVMNIMGDYTDVKSTAFKNIDSGAPQMVGISLTTALPTEKTDGELS